MSILSICHPLQYAGCLDVLSFLSSLVPKKVFFCDDLSRFLSCHSDLIRPSPKRQRIATVSASPVNAPAAAVVKEPSVVAEDLPSAAEVIAALEEMTEKLRRKILLSEVDGVGMVRMWMHCCFFWGGGGDCCAVDQTRIRNRMCTCLFVYYVLGCCWSKMSWVLFDGFCSDMIYLASSIHCHRIAS